ncbi:MAG: universal stress protein [Phycisphaerae bacterium]|nr:universal stress protein [Phycisphaerae bacterium]
MSHALYVAYDGSEPAKAALELALVLARPTGRRIEGLYVMELTPTLAAGDLAGVDPLAGSIGAALPSAEMIEAERDRGRAILADLKARCHAAGLPVETSIHLGSVIDTLEALAEPGDLIAVGRAGRGRFASGGVGSSARALVRGAPCPVLLAGPSRDGAAADVSRLVAVFDATPAAHRALAAAMDLARATGWSLTVLVIGGRATGAAPAGEAADPVPVVRAALAAGPGPAVPADVIAVEVKDEAHESALIAAVARHEHHALLVMGAFADSWLKDLFGTSVTGGVFKHVRGPMLLVHG